jgi:RNAse (barnase) inhibitor barstar
MKVLLTRLKKELQDKNQQPKQSLIDLELADYEKTIQNLKEDLINKDKDLQDLRDELSNSTDKYSCLKLEIGNLEQQKIQTEERANKFKALLDIAKKELQNAKDLELRRHQNEDDTRSLIEILQNQLDNNKILISELTNEKQQLTSKKFNYFFEEIFIEI